MHIEIRTGGKKKLYYLSHSFRDNGRVRKIRRYLGVNLSIEEVAKARIEAEKDIKKQIKGYKIIGDPLHTVLSPNEIKEVETLVAKGDIKIKHLSEDEWLKFTELFTYCTNAIEGSAVELPEVVNILEKDRWPNKSKEEISETYGVSEAVKYIRSTKDHMSLELMKELHRLVFKNSKPFAGEFRGIGVEVAVVGSSGNIIHRGAPQKQIIPLLRGLIEWYGKNKCKYHPILLAAIVHNQFENIHPFQDGNGRVGRLLLNNILLKHSFPPVNISFEKRGEYYSTLREYQNNGNIKPTIELIVREYRALKRFLKK